MGSLEKSQNSKVTETINEIIKGIGSGETAVFCGAGISRDSSLPIVNQIVPYILQKLEVPEEHIKILLDIDNNPNIPFEAFMESINKRFNRELIFNVYEQGIPNTNHILLAKLIKEGKLKTIVTTNFDKLIEKALSMKPFPMIQGIDYELLYKEKDFESIDWKKDQIRLIKIHGSIDDKESMAMTIKQIASQKLSQARFAVIKNIFSTGNHKKVLILGYSSSDVFDLSPQIQAIDENHKLVYYIQHKSISNVESIHVQQGKNPFKRYYDGLRLYYNTGDLIKVIWESCLAKNKPYREFTSAMNWKEKIDKWYLETMQKHSGVFKFTVPASLFLTMGELNLALKYYEQALKSSKEFGDIKGKEMSLGNLGVVSSNLGEYRKAKEYYEQALKIAKEIEDKKTEGLWLGSLGNAHIGLSEFNTAIEYIEQALKIAKEIEDKKSEGECLGNFGIAYERLGENRKAKEYYEQALNVAKEIGAKNMEVDWLGSLGVVLINLGEYRKAKEYIEQALQSAKELGSKKSEGIWLGGLGNVYYSLSEYKKAIEYYEKALKFAIEIGNKRNEITWHGNLGNAYIGLCDYEKAIEYFEQALKIAKEIEDKRKEGIWLYNLGFAYDSIDEYGKAKDCFKQSLNLLIPILGSDHPNIKMIEDRLRFIKLSEI